MNLRNKREGKPKRIGFDGDVHAKKELGRGDGPPVDGVQQECAVAVQDTCPCLIAKGPREDASDCGL